MPQFSFSPAILLALFAAAIARADITATWDGATSTWTDPVHWSTAPVFPQNNAPDFYDVVINAGVVSLDQNIIVNQLTLGGSGTLDGAFSLTTLEGWQWNGGSIRGSGALTLAGASTIASGVQALVLSERTINHAGSATFSAGTIRGGFGATLHNLAGATFTVLGDAAFFADPISPLYTFNNAGTFVARSNTGGGFTSMDAVFNNSGVVRVELAGSAAAHTLSLAGGGLHSGVFEVAAATALELGGATTLQAGTNFTGGGTVFVAGAVTVAGNISAENLEVAVGELNIGANVVTIDVSGRQSGGVARLGPGGTLRLNGAQTWVMDDGTLTGTGTLDGALDTQGIIAPGASLGTLRITGDTAFGADARLSLEIGGAAPGTFDVLLLDTQASLGGEIVVTLANGFLPGPTAIFPVLTAAGGASGTFLNAAVDGQRFFTADGLGSFEIDYTMDGVVLTAFIPEPTTALLVLFGCGPVFVRRRPFRR